MSELVLSLFPGIDILGRGFADRGFCVVRGPDLILDERIEDFPAPSPGRFDGIIGGPPCQNYSDANRLRRPEEGDRLVLEFLRCIDGARPKWFLMENVRNVPDVRPRGYQVQRLDLTDCECGGKQKRLRHIQFGSLDGSIIRPVRTKGTRPVTPAVLCRTTANDRHSRRLARQSAPMLPLRSLTAPARTRAVGNAVPWTMATTLALAVAERGPITDSDCVCGCGRAIAGSQSHATASCRKRMQRRREGQGRILATPAQSH